jgi:hypothetical protein
LVQYSGVHPWLIFLKTMYGLANKANILYFTSVRFKMSICIMSVVHLVSDFLFESLKLGGDSNGVEKFGSPC